MNGALRYRVRSVAARALRPVPTGLLVRAVLSGPTSMRRVARIALVGRRGRIVDGAGAGLHFICGSSNPDYLLGSNELPVQQEFARSIRPGDTVVDVGANVGFFTMLAARMTGPSGRVVAIEPEADNRSWVVENARANRFSHVHVVDAAAGAVSGEGALWIDAYSGGHALTTAPRPPHSRRSVAVRVVTIDELVTTGVAPHPALLKIDVEGAELDVLKGATETLDRYRPVLVVEVDDACEEAFRAKWEDVSTFLERRGYQVERIDGAYPEGGWKVTHAVARPRDMLAN